MPRAQAIRWAVEVARKFLDGTDVTAYGFCRVVTTLEFLQHHFSKMGHRDLLVTHNLAQPTGNPAPSSPREASAAGRLRSSRLTGHLCPGVRYCLHLLPCPTAINSSIKGLYPSTSLTISQARL